jgi:hypothetical protein
MKVIKVKATSTIVPATIAAKSKELPLAAKQPLTSHKFAALTRESKLVAL